MDSEGTDGGRLCTSTIAAAVAAEAIQETSIWPELAVVTLRLRPSNTDDESSSSFFDVEVAQLICAESATVYPSRRP